MAKQGTAGKVLKEGKDWGKLVIIAVLAVLFLPALIAKGCSAGVQSGAIEPGATGFVTGALAGGGAAAGLSKLNKLRAPGGPGGGGGLAALGGDRKGQTPESQATQPPATAAPTPTAAPSPTAPPATPPQSTPRPFTEPDPPPATVKPGTEFPRPTAPQSPWPRQTWPGGIPTPTVAGGGGAPSPGGLGGFGTSTTWNFVPPEPQAQPQAA